MKIITTGASVMRHSKIAGNRFSTSMGKGPPSMMTDWTVHGIAKARKTFWTFAPSALATAIDVLPCLATHMPEKTFGNDVPAAAIVKPKTSSEMPKSRWMPSQALTTEYAKMASQTMLITKDTGYNCWSWGLSISGMVLSTKNFTGNCSHPTHSHTAPMQLIASGASALPRRTSRSLARKALAQASMAFKFFDLTSRVSRRPSF
mmetsp:Transcript_56637/g.164132  ORF Transcript_56637/g.164132 Transcript_56637/m.164132 type:complete len:204 (+) Transcript_56637:759-1370(+)